MTSRQERGYDAAYDRERATWQRRLDRGERVLCWRCLEERGVRTPIDPSWWDLGHDDHDRSIIRGPECRGPNRATATRRARAGRRQPEIHPAVRDL